ncbi:putative periplasmic serine endoprotease DegP-like precursor [mine drainage metagenome]|uniref:Putative periplasmic serine endoprotease DegP-like n=1 Tax=mine drainage metagenome TaxID=410659 RepID=A0A1J5SR67_9ZZZZ
MFKFLLIFILAISSAPTYAKPSIYQDAGASSDSIRYFTLQQKASIDGGSFWLETYIWFDFNAFKPIDTPETPYLITVNTQTSDWIFIQQGQSLVLILDDKEELKLFTGGSERSSRISSIGNLRESANYWISFSQLIRIGKAKSIRFKLIGDNQMITGSWDGALLENAIYFATNAPTLIGDLTNTPIKLGVKYTLVTKEIAQVLKMPSTQGVFITSIDQGSYAEKFGLQPGDVILQFSANDITQIEDLPYQLQHAQYGTQIPILIWRNGKTSLILAKF